MSHIIQRNLAAEVERISSLKFPTTQNFQICTVINCLNIMLLLFTIFRYLPNFIFSRSTAHLMTSQKNNVIWAEQFQIHLLLALTSFGMLVKIKPIISSCFLYIWETFFKKLLKELRNCILCIVSVWSLFCSVRVYISLHFLPILW